MVPAFFRGRKEFPVFSNNGSISDIVVGLDKCFHRILQSDVVVNVASGSQLNVIHCFTNLIITDKMAGVHQYAINGIPKGSSSRRKGVFRVIFLKVPYWESSCAYRRKRACIHSRISSKQDIWLII